MTAPRSRIRHSGADLLPEALRSSSSKLIILFVVLYIPFVVVRGFQYRHVPNTDLPSFYTASVATFALKASPYSSSTLAPLSSQHVYPYLYPPPNLLLLYPFSLLTYDQARLGMLALNHVLILAGLLAIPMVLPRLAPRTDAMDVALSIAYTLIFNPLVATLEHGQVNIVLLAALVAFWLFARAGAAVAAGMFLAAAVLLKTYPIVLLPMLVACRRYRDVAATGAWLALALLFSIVLLPASVWHDWLFRVLPTGGYGREPSGLFSPGSIWNQSLNGFFSRLFTKSVWPDPVYFNPGLGRLCTYASAGLLCAVSLLAAWKTSGRPAGERVDRLMPVALPLIYLVAPFSWEHHLVYLLPTIIILLTAPCRIQRRGGAAAYRAAVAGSATLLAIPALVQWKVLAVLTLWGLSLRRAWEHESELPGGEEGGCQCCEARS